jgi:integrase
MRVHVLPSFVDKMIAAIERDDVRAIVEALDAKVVAATISWKTATSAWGLVTKMFSDACGSKVATLRVRTTDPATGVRGPDRGAKRGKQWLYPTEAAALLACSDVPLRWRRLYGLAMYLYLRPGELAALEWREVHDDQQYVHVHQSLDTRTGRVKATKTGVTRKVPIHPALARLLARMRLESGDKGRVLQHVHVNKRRDHGMPPLEDLAATLRDHLGRAGCTRSDLTVGRATTKVMTFYDLRATGITWEVLAGTEPIRIMQRAGHTNFATTQIYIREAETLGVTVGTPFGPLPDELCRPAQDDQSSRQSSTSSSALTTLAPNAGNLAARVGRRVASPRGTVR